MNSDEIMEFLSDYGTTSVHQSGIDGTYSARITLFVKGLTAEVKSGYNHPTMREALEELQARLRELLRTPPSIEAKRISREKN